MVRRYRGHDIWWWLRELGDLEQRREGGAPRPRSLTVTGAKGGEQLDLAVLHTLGVELTGRLTSFDGTTARFGDDLGCSVADAERRMTRVLDRIDERFPDLLDEPDRPPAVALPRARTSLDLAGIGTLIWATGYARSYPWLHADVFDEAGEIAQRDGITPVPGIYVLGRNFQSRRSSHFIGGVGRDAGFIAGQIVSRGRSGLERRPARAAPTYAFGGSEPA
jgi:putative flavoprotein involved in K+ transport